MKILLVGGGSGGHVTPLRAVATELLHNKTVELVVVTDRKFFSQTEQIFAQLPEVILKKIFAGKYRRYHGQSLLWHLTHLPTLFLNLRDIGLLKIGFLQSLVYMLKQRPDVVFAKGGFVSLPVGLAAKVLKIPLVIHDSDTHPGLTSRVLSRWSKVIATGMPKKYYPYEPAKTRYTGIPTGSDFVPVTAHDQLQRKQALNFDSKKPLLFITGGGTGAQRLNQALIRSAETLLRSGWQIMHLTGVGKSEEVVGARGSLSENLQDRWHIEEFTGQLADYVAAADIVMSRSGASAMQEFANSAKPVIVVPSPSLSGGHQVKNAQMFAQAGAVMYLTEADIAKNPNLIINTIQGLWSDKQKQAHKLASILHREFAKPEAAKQLAEIITTATN